jgi:3'(2'), 5'-bisphosphate nucleotidase
MAGQESIEKLVRGLEGAEVYTMDATQSSLIPWLTEARRLARAAGREIVALYHSDFTVEHKQDRTPLTAADLASHRLITEGLATLTPILPILSEESQQLPFSERSHWSLYWLIDPLDGTREFVKRNGEFSVNIALIKDHEPILGVVHAPVLCTSYYACRGMGAFKEDAAGRSTPIRVRQAPSCPVVAGSRSHASTSLNAFLEKLGEHRLISMGSALKSCLVAEGVADIYPRFGPTSEWDTAAAQCVVEEAGGFLTDTKMQPLRYNTKESLINPSFLVFGDASYDWAMYL